MRIECVAASDSVDDFPDGLLPLVLYSRPDQPSVASAGAALQEVVAKHRLLPATRAWDLLSVALAVIVADTATRTDESPDGWTRQINLRVAVSEPEYWATQKGLIERLLRFLTSDLWEIEFFGASHGYTLKKTPVYPENDCVSLLSGGLDSLVGAIDLAASGKNPLVVSQVAQGDKDTQSDFASKIAGGLRHLQLAHNATVPGATEDSQRARSIAFLAYGVLAATALQKYHDGDSVTLYVCENGFISINPPLTEMRIGSYSTRTTHPTYLGLLQRLIDNSGIRVRLANPYQFLTKGRMLRDCLDQGMLEAIGHESTSCGRYARHYQHCGRCVPCLIRRAAFHEWDHWDATDYRYAELGKADGDHAHFDDVRAALMAVESLEADGVEKWVGAQLCSEFIEDSQPFLDTIELGLCELSVFLKSQGAS